VSLRPHSPQPNPAATTQGKRGYRIRISFGKKGQKYGLDTGQAQNYS